MQFFEIVSWMELVFVKRRKASNSVKLRYGTRRRSWSCVRLRWCSEFGIRPAPREDWAFKFQRAIVSEIIGVDAATGVKTSSRMDPLSVQLKAGPVYEGKDGSWTLDESNARVEKKKPVLAGKDGKPSEVNHGNITPSLSDTGRDPLGNGDERLYLAGGVTLGYAEQTTVLSFPALRRLRFPLTDGIDQEKNLIAQTALAALGICGAALVAERGLDLRSRCLLWPTEKLKWELLGQPGDAPQPFEISGDESVAPGERGSRQTQGSRFALANRTACSQAICQTRRARSQESGTGDREQGRWRR